MFVHIHFHTINENKCHINMHIHFHPINENVFSHVPNNLVKLCTFILTLHVPNNLV